MSGVSEENMGAQINEFGSAVQIWQVFYIQLEVDWLIILVLSMDLNFVDGAITHLWQKAGLVLGTSS